MHVVTALILCGILAAYCLFVISALGGALVSRFGLGTKIVWIAVIFALPFLGSLLWHLVGKKSANPGTSASHI